MKLKFSARSFRIIATSTFCIGCFLLINKTRAQEKISKYQLRVVMPKYNEDTSRIILEDILEVFKNKDFTLYRLPRIHLLEKDHIVLRKEVRYSTFIFENGKRSGFFVKDEFEPLNEEKADVDSFLKERAFVGMDFFQPESVDLVQTITGPENITKIFAVKKSEDEFRVDSLYIYYNKEAMGIDFSLSKKLDTISMYKLYKCNIISLPFFSATYNMDIPRREFIFELTNFKGMRPEEERYFHFFSEQIKGRD